MNNDLGKEKIKLLTGILTTSVLFHPRALYTTTTYISGNNDLIFSFVLIRANVPHIPPNRNLM